MQKFIIGFICLLLPYAAMANNSYEPLLNSVNLQLDADKWVTTKSALVSMSVNVSASGNDLDKVQNQVLGKLRQVSDKGKWRIVSFNRALDQSGLESVRIMAEARLPSEDLGGIRDRAKALSKPGEKYDLNNISYKPSDAEIRQANLVLRYNIYNQAKYEIDNLNKMYPDQKFFVHDIRFRGSVMPMPRAVAYVKSAESDQPRKVSDSISVGNKLIVTASVTLSSAPSEAVKKIVHG